MTIRGVIFDYGKVLSAPANPDAFARMVSTSGLSRKTFEREYWRHRPAYDLGLTAAQFWRAVGSGAGASFTAEQIRSLTEDDLRTWTSLNETMMTWVGDLQKAGIRTAILSNMTREIMAYMLKNFRWLSGFDCLTWSCELGVAKPDPAIYRRTVRKLELPPDRVLFLDDNSENVAGAERVGLRALQFADAAQLRDDLSARGLADALPAIAEPVRA